MQPQTIQLWHRDTGEPAIFNVADGALAESLGYFINTPDTRKPKPKKENEGVDRRPIPQPVRSS